MTVVLFLLVLIIFVLLSGIASVRPGRSTMSEFELRRRINMHDEAAMVNQVRNDLYEDVIVAQKIVVALLIVILVALSIATFGWFLGILLACCEVLLYGRVAGFDMLRSRVQSLYTEHEILILQTVEKLEPTIKLLRTVPLAIDSPFRLASRDELLHIVDQSGGILKADEKQLIRFGLTFSHKQVKEIMIPRSVIDSIEQTELLGPLTLDQLHKTGHSRFPVTEGNIDHVVGILHVHDLLTLRDKESVTVKDVMETRVYYIHQDQSLQHALAAFIRTHHHLFVVVNEFRETVGLLSLEDVMESLLGRKIVDEFDAHDDLRAVAERNLHHNNTTGNRVDV